MKKIFALTLILIVMNSGTQAQPSIYKRIQVPFPHYLNLNGLGLPMEEAHIRPGAWAQIELGDTEIQKIQSLGIPFQTLVSDLSGYYEERALQSSLQRSSASSQYPVPLGFHLGSMGGHLTYQEVLDELDSMVTQYPQLISARQPIGTYLTTQGRPIFWVKISDNPNLNEPEPQVLYTSLHHAREPAGLMTLLYYMHYLLENYQSDPEAQYLINNREMYFILVINPDGYVYNQSTHPNGGGMWRKNLRNNGDGSYGVDLNRNYGFKWGLDNTGSSPFPQDETYRGPGAFSEPEIQAVRDFCNSHNFRLALNYHTYANLLLYPWGWTDQELTPDDDAFQAIAMRMTRDNQYAYGPGSTTIYQTNGGSDDWMYGDTLFKSKILSYTPELGNSVDGFWASPSRIIPICQENMIQNLIAAHVVGTYADAIEQGSPFLPALSGFIPIEIQRLGIDSLQTYTLSLQGISGVTSTGSALAFQGMGYLEKRLDSISFMLDPNLLPGQVVSFLLGVSNGQYTHYDTITKVYGQPIPLFQDHASQMQNWSSSAWGLSSTYFVSAPYSFADSPSGTYMPNVNSHLTLNNSINLSSSAFALLSFNARWEIEAGWDYAQVLISMDNGLSWAPVGGKYSKLGSDYQAVGEPVYDGFQTSWVQEHIDLKDFLGQPIRIRFLFISDNYVQYEGFYVDDIVISSIDISAGLETASKQAQARVFPNPTGNTLFIQWPYLQSDVSSSLEIYSITGSHIRSMEIRPSPGIIEIDIHDLNPGAYICRILRNTGDPVQAHFIKL